jgi:hypothetical protein
MANRQKGEISIDVGGTSYTMALTVDAMCQLEDLFSTPQKAMTFQQVIELADGGSIKHLRGLLWAALQLHHPELEIKDISPLVQSAGGIKVFVATFMRLAKESFADPQDVEALGIKPDANPPQAPGGKRTRTTGAGSTSMPGASV